MNNSVDELITNLVELGFTPKTKINRKMLLPISGDRMMGQKLILAEIHESIYFLAFDSYISKGFSSSTISGLYSPVSMLSQIDLKIYKKERIADLLIPNKRKVGVKLIDNSITVSSKYIFPNDIVSEQLVSDFIDLCNKGKNFVMLIGKHNKTILDFFEGEQIIGLETSSWIYKKEDLSELIASGVKIIESVKDKINKLKF